MWQEYPLFQEPDEEEPFIVMAVKDGTPANMHVLLRGNHHTPGEEAPRRFLQIIAGENHPAINTEQSGRLELARWIASPGKPTDRTRDGQPYLAGPLRYWPGREQ